MPHFVPDEGHKCRQVLADLILLDHTSRSVSPAVPDPKRFFRHSNFPKDSTLLSQYPSVSAFTRHTVGRFPRSSYTNFNTKVVPRSAVNPDFLEPFNCKGLFTTTHAIKHRSSVKSVEKTWHEQLATVAHLFLKVNTWLRLPDRNSEPGSIGIGQIPGLRTLFMNNTYNQLTGGLA